MSQKIVVNFYYGGMFCFSKEAILRLRELGCEEARKINLNKDKIERDQDYYLKGYLLEISRDNKYVVQVVEELGEKAAGEDSYLKIVEIPDGIEWHIENEQNDSELIISNGSEYVVEGKNPVRIWKPKFL